MVHLRVFYLIILQLFNNINRNTEYNPYMAFRLMRYGIFSGIS